MKLTHALVLSAATATAAVVDAQIAPMVVGGTEVPVGEKTWMVGIRGESVVGELTYCGGMLITPTHVLTAGHCPTFGNVNVGTHFARNSTDGEVIDIVSEVRHPKYNEPNDNAVEWDYKIITLAKPSKYKPVKIIIDNPTVDPIVGKYATSMGWGYTVEVSDDTLGMTSDVLLRVDLQLKTMEECAALGMTPLDETMVCAGGVEGKDTCDGDSGGPLFLETSKGDGIIGIVSWGNGCARKDQPGVYSRVSTVLDWIKELAPGAKFFSYPDN